jgi:hypothetical protein
MNDIEIRTHERIDYKRCQLKWYWHWRMGLVPMARSYGDLDLGRWTHAALAAWYSGDRDNKLVDVFNKVVSDDMNTQPNNLMEYQKEKISELAQLGMEMMLGYQRHYHHNDADVIPVKCEVPLKFKLAPGLTYGMTLDMVFCDPFGRVWIMEHKTAKSINRTWLPLAEQTLAYIALSERCLVDSGLFTSTTSLHGIMYNFIRKTRMDSRQHNDQGLALNKNGTVSKRQVVDSFVRVPIRIPTLGKIDTLNRLAHECGEIAEATLMSRVGDKDASNFLSTPHTSCTRCDYFTLCLNRTYGGNVRDLIKKMYRVVDPYTYTRNTEIPASFELG